MSIRAVGTIHHTDEHADYYGGVERLSDRASFGVYQHVTFRDPETELVFVGKPHSFWWSKADLEFQCEVQVFPYVPLNERILSIPGAPIELYSTHGDMIEIPASCICERLEGKVVYVPPSVPDSQIVNFVQDAPLADYPVSEGDTDDEADRAEDAAVRDEDDNRSHFFYKFAKRPGESPSPSLPPKFHDAWSCFVERHVTKSRFWNHDFTRMIKEEYLAAPIRALDSTTPFDDVFFAIQSDSYVVEDPNSIRWTAGGPSRAVGSDDLQSIARIKAFMTSMSQLKGEGADSTTTFALCREFSAAAP